MIAKRSPYTGVLAEPLELETPLGLSLDKVPRTYLDLGFPAEAWPTTLKASLWGDLEKIFARSRALFRHFGINPEDPHAFLDLALCLAYRHERDTLVDGERVRFGAVCTRFETTDPAELVRKLAAKHVRGFQPARSRRLPGRLSTTEWVEIFFAVIVVADRLERRGGEAKVREIAAVMLDQKELQKIIPRKAARSVQAILERTGNKERGSARGLKSRDTFLRTRIREARRARADVRSGKANNFQMQMLTEVWPALHGLTMEQAGQNAPVSETTKTGFDLPR